MTVFLPRESRGQRRLVGYGPWGFEESDMTEHMYITYVCFLTLIGVSKFTYNIEFQCI